MPIPGLMLSTFPNLLCDNSESLVVTNMLIAKTNGMWDAGWRIVLVEDGQYAPSRDTNGNLVADPVRFPHGFPFLVNVAHTNGFKIGGYSSGGNVGCCHDHNPGTPPALLAQHIRQHLEWGFDGMVIDACGVAGNPVERLLHVMRTFNQVAFETASSYLSASQNRGMFLILNQNDGSGGVAPWESIYEVNCIGVNASQSPGAGNLSEALSIARECLAYSYLIGPGHYVNPTALRPDTYPLYAYSDPAKLKQFLSFYYMTASPIQISLQPYSTNALSLLTNTEALAIDQDAAVIPCHVAYSNNLVEVWTRPLGGYYSGSNAVLIINASTMHQTSTVTSAMLGQPFTTELTLRDPWSHTTLSNFTGAFTYPLAAKTVALLTTFNQFQTAAAQFAAGLQMPTNGPPANSTTVRVWFNITNKNDGQVYKIPGYQ